MMTVNATGSLPLNPEFDKSPAESAVHSPAIRTCILVLGMHRSGTSALTRALSLMGAALPKNVIGIEPANETGHWEPSRLVDLNNRLMAQAGSDWSDWRQLDTHALGDSSLASYRAQISKIIDDEYGDGSLFVIKDPRISRFVQLYDGVLREKNVDVKIAHIFRNPLSVCASLQKRDGFSAGFSSMIWLRHHLDAERATRGMARSLVAYESLVESSSEALGKVVGDLSLDNVGSVDSKLSTYISDDYRHHRHSEADVATSEYLTPWVRSAYRALQMMTVPDLHSAAQAILDDVRHEFDYSGKIFGDIFYAEIGRMRSL